MPPRIKIDGELYNSTTTHRTTTTVTTATAKGIEPGDSGREGPFKLDCVDADPRGNWPAMASHFPFG